jgi:hypothetical protein
MESLRGFHVPLYTTQYFIGLGSLGSSFPESRGPPGPWFEWLSYFSD